MPDRQVKSRFREPRGFIGILEAKEKRYIHNFNHWLREELYSITPGNHVIKCYSEIIKRQHIGEYISTRYNFVEIKEHKHRGIKI